MQSAQLLSVYLRRNRGGSRIEQFSLNWLVTGLTQPGLIIHDRDVTFEQASELVEHWPRSQLHATTGLGQRRILRGGAVIGTILAFVLAEQAQPAEIESAVVS